jgi:hypothetical protein
MKKTPNRGGLIRVLGAGGAVASLGWALLSASPALAANREAKMFAITQWTTECSGGTRDSWDDMARGWYDEVTDHGVFYKDGAYVNGTMSRGRFCDPDAPTNTSCADDSYLDDADAAIIALHGSDSSNHWAGSLRVKDASGQCMLDAAEGASSDDLFAGDVDLEFLHLSSCFSMDDDNINSSWRMFQDGDSAKNGQRLHQVDGFHGIMWISSGRVDDYEDFADDAYDVSIRTAWLDNMYDDDAGSNSDEQCPVALSVGSTPTDALNRLRGERYNNIYSDPGDIHGWAYGFFEGCDPASETPFNDPND